MFYAIYVHYTINQLTCYVFLGDEVMAIGEGFSFYIKSFPNHPHPLCNFHIRNGNELFNLKTSLNPRPHNLHLLLPPPHTQH